MFSQMDASKYLNNRYLLLHANYARKQIKRETTHPTHFIMLVYSLYQTRKGKLGRENGKKGKCYKPILFVIHIQNSK